MLVQEFIDKYCQDIVQMVERVGDPLASSEFSFDSWVEMEDGRREKVVYSATSEILVRDIVELTKEDFVRKYTSKEDLDTYERYLSSFVILYGEEVITRARMEVERAKQNLERAKNFDPTNIWKPW
jgi:hypothetical protein